MQKVEEIQSEIEALRPEEFARLSKWFAEKEWERWDMQLEGDVAAGRLEFLIDEALAAKDQQLLR